MIEVGHAGQYLSRDAAGTQLCTSLSRSALAIVLHFLRDVVGL